MRDFHRLDLNSLKAFYHAARELNFTRAADRAGLTQSGVSQHVRKLEESLGSPLFLRTQKKVSLTDAGQELQRFTEIYLDSVDALFDRVSQKGAALKGDVSYAMPESCLFTPHFSMLLDRHQSGFDDVRLQVQIHDSRKVAELVLEGKIDFGFITKRLANRELELREFARETYILAAKKFSALDFQSPKDLKELGFIRYPGMDELFEHWFAADFPKAQPVRLDELRITAEVDHLRAAITMVEKGLGVGVFPRHCLEPQLKAKSIAVRGCDRALEYPIYIVTRRDQVQPARVRAVLDAFWDMKKK